jgi:beta-glucosidase
MKSCARPCVFMVLVVILLGLCRPLTGSGRQAPSQAYLDPSLPIERRVDDLISRMTLEEKVSQMMNGAGPIDRLGIPKYDWWNEGLHGVARAGYATVFPQAIGLAATWDPDLMHEVATTISTEARAKYNEFVRQGDHGRYKGLTFWSPNINIFRDPRWGRGQETYGEDPYLTARLAVAFVKGMQGDDPRYLKVVATPKHYAVHSGPEPERHGFDAVVDERDLRETYLPAFRAAIVEGKAASVMCAYNRTDGEPCCANKRLLTDILRQEWGFNGYVVSDCGAIDDIYKHHSYAKSVDQASALAVKAGTDLSCGTEYKSLVQAVNDKLISEAEIDTALKHLMTARFRLGMFDPPDMVPYSRIPFSENDSPEHRALSLKAARESLVLLKNQNHTLPLSRSLKTIAVIGPNANAPEVLLGNYNGKPSKSVTPLEGIRNNLPPETKILYAQGATLTGEERGSGPGASGRPQGDPNSVGTPRRSAEELKAEAISMARQADAVIVVLGIAPSIEGEEMKVNINGFRGGDRTALELPKAQEDLLKAVQSVGKPVVLVLLGGSALAVNWADENVPAIVDAWYPGEEGGTALAELLFGDYNPAGRLPVTFYKSADQLPPFTDYRMQGRTYRYFKDEPLYSFGFGLSFTSFKYDDLQFSSKRVKPGEGVTVSVNVRNTGDRAGDEVVQMYVTHMGASVPVPIRSLAGISRVFLRPGEARKISFPLNREQMSVIDNSGRRVVEAGEFEVSVGGSQPGLTGRAGADAARPVSGRLEVRGASIRIP